MKNILFPMLFSILTIAIFSCGDDKEDAKPQSQNIVPTAFKVAIPNSISSQNPGGKTISNSINGFDAALFYQAIPVYIEIGELSAEFVEEIMLGIYTYNLSGAQSLNFVSNDDGRDKFLEVKENVTLNGATYQYGMQITDVLANEVGMQVFWNLNPTKGIAIANFYHLDRSKNDSTFANTFYKVSYDESPANGDAEMEVWLSDYPILASDTFAIDKLRMWVNKDADIISVNGSSSHPNLQFDNGNSGVIGRNYSFRAKSDEVKDVALIEFGLPPSDVNSTSNMYTVYNILEVLTNEYGSAIQSQVANWKAPGYFDGSSGFLGDGDYNADPNLFTINLTDLSTLNPFIPRDVRDQTISFENF